VTRAYVVALNVSRTIISIAVGAAGFYLLSKRVRDVPKVAAMIGW